VAMVGAFGALNDEAGVTERATRNSRRPGLALSAKCGGGDAATRVIVRCKMSEKPGVSRQRWEANELCGTIPSSVVLTKSRFVGMSTPGELL
jgi:hypothetical protein